MAKKQLQSGLTLSGIAPNILLKHVDNTVPFLFKGEIDTTGKEKAYLAKLVHYKKNLNLLKNIDLAEYFHICMSAHWATAGTFVPTDVDIQIREGLWRHGEVGRHIDKMARITIDSWLWDYSQVTNRKSYNINRNQVMSTHEGTWFSVAIGAYCALKKNNKMSLANEIADVILAEADKEEKLLLDLQSQRDHKNYLRTCALMAHNFGDLDRVVDLWNMADDDPFKQRIYKLGHRLNPNYSPILFYSGLINKTFLSVENHRHMSLRQPRSLRRSYKFLVPAGPYMDEWGEVLGSSPDLSLEEKAEIITALFDGYNRQDQAFGYIRAFRGLTNALPDGFNTMEDFLPFNLVQDIRQSKFFELSHIPLEEFEESFKKRLLDFKTELTDFRF
jgi:hypothetical protein